MPAKKHTLHDEIQHCLNAVHKAQDHISNASLRIEEDKPVEAAYATTTLQDLKCAEQRIEFLLSRIPQQ